MRRLLVVLAALLCLASPALADKTSTLFSGYIYPTNGSQNLTNAARSCSPSCTEADLTYIVPQLVYSGSGHSEGVWFWLGMTSPLGGTVKNCAGSVCLGQIGIAIAISTGSVQTCGIWYELAPTQFLQWVSPQASFPCVPGDVNKLQMTCATNCTPDNLSQTWNVSHQNFTHPWTWNNGGVAFTWPLSMSFVPAVAEYTNGGTWLAGGPSCINCDAPNYATPGLQVLSFNVTENGVLKAVPLGGQQIMTYHNTGNTRFSSPSGPANGPGNGSSSGFTICAGSSLPSCSNGPFTPAPVGGTM